MDAREWVRENGCPTRASPSGPAPGPDCCYTSRSPHCQTHMSIPLHCEWTSDLRLDPHESSTNGYKNGALTCPDKHYRRKPCIIPRVDQCGLADWCCRFEDNSRARHIRRRLSWKHACMRIGSKACRRGCMHCGSPGGGRHRLGSPSTRMRTCQQLQPVRLSALSSPQLCQSKACRRSSPLSKL